MFLEYLKIDCIQCVESIPTPVFTVVYGSVWSPLLKVPDSSLISHACFFFISLFIVIHLTFKVAMRGVTVAEFNMETTPATNRLGGKGFFFEGPCGTFLPQALAE